MEASDIAGGGGSGGKERRSSAPAMTKLSQPHITLTSAEDSPTPRERANGV
jgi:hypothetical protein